MLSYSYSYTYVIMDIRNNRVNKRKAGTTTAPAFLDDFFFKSLCHRIPNGNTSNYPSAHSAIEFTSNNDSALSPNL